MSKSSKQILLVAVIVAVITSAFIYYANSNEPTPATLTASGNTTEIAGADTTPLENEEPSMGDDTEVLDPVSVAPNVASQMTETVACLKEKGVVIYGSRTCPACAQMVTLFKGYEVIDPIYVECQTSGLRCSQEMQTQYVPEVQIAGNLFKGPATPAAISAAVGCAL
jgi:hypothetical protein